MSSANVRSKWLQIWCRSRNQGRLGGTRNSDSAPELPMDLVEAALSSDLENLSRRKVNTLRSHLKIVEFGI